MCTAGTAGTTPVEEEVGGAATTATSTGSWIARASSGQASAAHILSVPGGGWGGGPHRHSTPLAQVAGRGAEAGRRVKWPRSLSPSATRLAHTIAYFAGGVNATPPRGLP